MLGMCRVRLGEQSCPSRERLRRIDSMERTAQGRHYMRVFGYKASPVMMLVGRLWKPH